MKRHLLLGAAVAAMFTTHSFAQVVLDENFDDGLAASRFTVNVIKSSNNTGTNPTANFAYDYGTFIYNSYSFPGQTLTTLPIPAAPGSSTTIGLRVANTPLGSGTNAGSSLAVLPNAVNVTGDFKIEGYSWQNYNGGPGDYVATMGGTGSTESMTVGLNRDGTGAAGYLPTGATRANGYTFGAAHEGGASNDYQIFNNDTWDDGANYAKRNAAWQGGVSENRVSFTNPNEILATGFTDSPANHLNTYNRNEVFPADQGFEIPGAPAKHWVKFEMEQRGQIVFWSMNGKVISTLFTADVYNGKPQFGYADVNNGSIPNPADSNFTVYDNLKVTQQTSAPTNSITADTFAIFDTSTAVNGAASLRGLTLKTASNVTLSGTGALTMAGNGAAILSLEGTNTISKPLTLNADMAIMVGNSGSGTTSSNPSNGAILNLPDVSYGTGVTVVKNGLGTLNIQKVRGDGLTLVDGVLKLTGAGPGSVTRITGYNQQYGTTSSFDIGKSAVAIDYVPRTNPNDATQTNSPLKYITDRIIIGFNSGTWDGKGITSSALQGTPPANVALRISEASVLGYTDGSTWGATGLPIDASAVVFGYTFTSDTNLDQAINFDDLLKLAQNYNATYDPIAEGVKWYIGDSNGDGSVNFDDLLALAQGYGTAISLVGVTTDTTLQANFQNDWALALSMVPEPTSLSALALGGLMLRRRR